MARYAWRTDARGNRYFERVAGPAVVPVTKPEPAPDYSQLLKADLVALAEQRGLDASGTKADILSRLEGKS